MFSKISAAAIVIISSVIVAVPIVGGSVTNSAPTYSTVDTSGTPASVYRIVADAVTNDGTLVSCYDSRNLSSNDLPADIDITCKNSTDKGSTWSARRTAVTHTGGNTDSTAYGVGDGQLTYDPSNNTLFLFYEAAPPAVGLNNSSTDTSATSLTTVHVVYRTSIDDGNNWSAVRDLTAVSKTPGNVTGIFASSGHGLYTSTGGLLIPYSYMQNNVLYTGVLWSTDHGVNWGQQSIGIAGNENKMVQLSNGNLIDDIRSNAGGPLYRQFSTFNNSWSPATIQYGMPDPLVNGDIIAVPGTNWLLESNPDSQTARYNGVVRLSKDGGATWPYGWTVNNNSYWQFGYSSMVSFADGTFGIMYEHTASDNGASLEFSHFNLSQFAQ